VFASLPHAGAGGLAIAGDGLFVVQAAQIAALAIQYGVPAIFQTSEFAAAGGLMNYEPYLAEEFRMVGIYTGRILKEKGRLTYRSSR
jgi:putative tryptophan/tyrosine transport system substrate-binding protein